eukprot:7245568-Pyramimonas_sp.AAC.1
MCCKLCCASYVLQAMWCKIRGANNLAKREVANSDARAITQPIRSQLDLHNPCGHDCGDYLALADGSLRLR